MIVSHKFLSSNEYKNFIQQLNDEEIVNNGQVTAIEARANALNNQNAKNFVKDIINLVQSITNDEALEYLNLIDFSNADSLQQSGLEKNTKDLLILKLDEKYTALINEFQNEEIKSDYLNKINISKANFDSLKNFASIYEKGYKIDKLFTYVNQSTFVGLNDEDKNNLKDKILLNPN
ncbi:UNVERIFIED_CONTAM: hypothetical protein O8I53_08620 [Campylobacter lari]